MQSWDVVVIGAGPAGLMAATHAARRGLRTLLFEKNRKPGAKILISGGTHCNLTHDTDARGIADAFGRQGRFLRPALGRFTPQDLTALMADHGVPTYVEPGGKIFPVSMKASDVLGVCLRLLQESGATTAPAEPVRSVERTDDGAGFRIRTDAREVFASRLVAAVGGMSYPGCGTTGDGYAWAAALGHTIVAPRAALTPLTTEEAWVKELQGVTIVDGAVRVVSREACEPVLPAGVEGIEGPSLCVRSGLKRADVLAEARGSLLFTHVGLSGPVALDVSREVSAFPRGRRPVLVCDFLPETSEAELDQRLADAVAAVARRLAGHWLDDWIPNRLGRILAAAAGIPADRRCADVRRDERRRLTRLVKGTVIPLTGTLGFEKAEVTAGGIALDEIDPRTMQSKIVPGFFAAGELLDLDGPIGGYNLQAAFSTGRLAGEFV